MRLIHVLAVLLAPTVSLGQSTKPTSKPTTENASQTVMTLLERIPKNIYPRDKPLTEISANRANDWIKTNVKGQPLTITIKFNGAGRPDATLKIIRVAATLESFDYGGVHYGGPSVCANFPDSLADKLSELDEGDEITISGKIANFYVLNTHDPKYAGVSLFLDAPSFSRSFVSAIMPTTTPEDEEASRPLVKLLEQIPKNIYPGNKEWDELTKTRANEWLKKKATDQKFSMRLAFTKASVMKSGEISVPFDPKPFEWAGLHYLPHVFVSFPASFADKLSALRKGDEITVSGTITIIDVGGSEPKYGSIILFINDGSF